MTRGRAILSGAVFLALGALTTIGAAWGLACADIRSPGKSSAQRVRPSPGPVVHEPMGGPADGVSVVVYRRPGRTLVLTSCFGPEFQPLPGIPGAFHEQVDTPPRELIPPELRAMALPWEHGEPWPRSWDTGWCEVAASGWPVAALASARRVGSSGGREVFGGIELGGNRAYGETSFFTQTVPRVLPARPLPLGFAADTLLYGAGWWGLVAGIAGLRRTNRRRKGRCRACGYDRRGLAPGSACPECGAVGGVDP